MITLNCDMGESFGNWHFGDDEGIMPSVDCANIACGFHASDPSTMLKTVRLAGSLGKTIGAHPSLPDREGFGRRVMQLQPDELRSCFIYQIGALFGFVRSEGLELSYVKPHGMIYGMAARDLDAAVAIAEAAGSHELALFGMAGTAHQTAAEQVGIPFFGEYFADLSYLGDGSLIIPRKHGVINVERAKERLERAISNSTVEAADGTSLAIEFDTVCIHSDPPNARDVALSMKAVLDVARNEG